MATDSLALALAAFAGMMAGRPASPRHSYGLGRVEVMAALVNTLLMLAIVAASWSKPARICALPLRCMHRW